MIASCDQVGIDATAGLRAANIDVASLDDPFSTVPTEAFVTLLQHVFVGPDITLATRLGLAVPPDAMGLYDHLVTTGSTWWDIFELSDRYRALVSRTTSFQLIRGSEPWLWVFDRAPSPAYRAITEQWSLAAMFARCRQRYPEIQIREVHMTLPDSGNADLFAKHWGVPVRLGMPRSGMRYAQDVADLPNPNSNPHLQATLRRILDREEVQRISATPFMRSLHSDLAGLFARGVSTVNAAAAELGCSRRSLQRRLTRDNISFRALLSTYRRETVFAMLRAGDRNVNEIAYSVGYSGETALNRAFHRWTGLSPTEWARLELDRRA